MEVNRNFFAPKYSVNNECLRTYKEDVEMLTNGGMFVSFDIEGINTGEVLDLSDDYLTLNDCVMKLSSDGGRSEPPLTDGTLALSADGCHDNLTLTDSAVTLSSNGRHLVLHGESEYEMNFIEVNSGAMQLSPATEPESDVCYSWRNCETSSVPFISDRTHVCSWCEKTFVRVSTLRVHERIHKGEKPFGCVDCDKRFTQSTDLLKHRRIHTGERPFGCAICNRRFAQASNLRVHLRTHTRALPFSCPLCDKKFNLASNLQVHERTHSGERPFACYQCDMWFIQISHLQRHIAVHTKKDCSR